LIVTGALTLCGVGARAAQVDSPGFLKFEAWNGITGNAVADLLADPRYPATPDVVGYVAGFDSRSIYPNDSHETFGGQISGFIVPDASGDYDFFLRSDDGSELWLSTDATTVNLQLIAQETGCCNAFLEPPAAQATTTPISLVAGQRYAVRALYKEGTGGDFCQVAWRKVGDTTAAGALKPLAGDFIVTTADNTGASVSITQQPQSQTVAENGTVTFSVTANATSPLSAAVAYQWKRNGVGIPSANGASYTIPIVKLANNNDKYSVRVMVLGANALSADATLTVTSDTTRPTIVKVSGSEAFTNVTVTFSEDVTAATAGAVGNYGLNGGLTISSATVLDARSVQLATSRQTEGTSYVLTANNIQDTASPANTIVANTQVPFSSFVFSRGFLKFEAFNNAGAGIPGSIAQNLIDDPRYQANIADFTAFITPFDSRAAYPDDSHEAYGARISGFVIPQQSGNYEFMTRSDDGSQFFMSTDANPANLAGPLAEETGCCDTYHESGDPETTAPIALVANQRYYVQFLYKEGGGGDYGQVAWRREGDTTPAVSLLPIPGPFLGTFADPGGANVTITQQPQNASIVENTSATFTVAATGSATIFFFQWQKAAAGGAFSDIIGANRATYTTPTLPMSENGNRYRVAVSVPGATVNSAEATVTLLADTSPPTLVAARRSFADNTKVNVVFSELMQPASANVAANYTINNGITVSAAALQSDNKTVVLTTSPIAGGTSNTLTVNGVRDAVGNQIAANSTMPIIIERGALFVHAAAGPNASDNVVISRLQSQGYFVETVGSVASDTTMATGKNLVITSSTVPSGDVTTKFKDVAVPVIDWEQALQDDYAMTDPAGTTDRGTTGGQTSLEIVDATHPLAAGLPAGVVTVTTAPVDFAWGQPNANAKAVARLVGTTGNYGIYGYDKGALLYDGTPAPERRVLIFFTDNAAAVLNADGFKLLDAAVNWAQNLTVSAQPKFNAPTLANGQVTLSWTGTGALEQADTVTGSWGPAPSQANPQTVSATGTKFYRVKQ